MHIHGALIPENATRWSSRGMAKGSGPVGVDGATHLSGLLAASDGKVQLRTQRRFCRYNVSENDRVLFENYFDEDIYQRDCTLFWRYYRDISSRSTSPIT